MHATDFESSSDDSGAGDDPHQSSAVPNSLLLLQGDYASCSDSVVLATPEKSYEEQDCSDDHTPAQRSQPSKRRRLPTPSPTTRKGIPPVPARESDSDGVEYDSLFDCPSTRKRGFKRPRLPWSLVKEWSLDEYDREVAYEEIKVILTQSLDEAGTKTFIKPNANSIAGWRPKQVSDGFLRILLSYTNFFVLFIVELCVTRLGLHAQYIWLSIC